MSEIRYDIFFRGESLANHELSAVKQRFIKLFKLDADKAEQFFSGKVITLRKNLDKTATIKFKRALEHIGAKVYIRQAAETAAQKQQVKPVELAILPTGSDVLAQNERSQIAAKEIDLSHLTISDSELVNDEQSEAAPPAPDVSHLSAAEVGADVLEGYQHEAIPLPEPDTSHLSLASDEMLLEQNEQQAPKAPDVSHISLVD